MPVRVIDSSLLIEARHKGVLGELERDLNSGDRAVAPPMVYHETVTEPGKKPWLASSAHQIEKLFTHGAITTEPPDYSDPQVSDVVDKVRDCIAAKSGKPAHLVEKADLQIVALAIFHAMKDGRVEIIFRDQALRDCLVKAIRARGISGVSITSVDTLIRSL